MSRKALLSAQLSNLQTPSFHPDSEDHLEGLSSHQREDNDLNGGNGYDKEHYVNVGPSRLKGLSNGHILNGPKYEGKTVGRQKIFDDDDDESDEDLEDYEENGMDSEDSDEEDDDDDDEDEDEDQDQEEDEDSEEGDENEEEDDSEGERKDDPRNDLSMKPNGKITQPSMKPATKSLDPLAVLRDSKAKDVLKGKAIKRQKNLFESLLTMRITYQKALTSLSKLPTTILSPQEDPENEISSSRSKALERLSDLNEELFKLRYQLKLPGVELSENLGKRKREDTDIDKEKYWLRSAKEDLNMVDKTSVQLLPILSKWSTKIQAAQVSVGSKTIGGNKFSQQNQKGIIEAVESSLSNKRNSTPTLTLQDLIDPSYRSLLREIISTRSTLPSSIPSTYRLEKKKKRNEERGNSKGRKIRYTVHEKAANFTVPQDFRGGWEDNQMDELFGSLLGGVGIKEGGRSEGGVAMGLNGEDDDDDEAEDRMGGEDKEEKVVGETSEGLVGLGGLKVF